MSSSDDDHVAALETVYKSVRDYARPELEGLVQKVVHQLQRLPASGIYGDDFRYKTLWDEYCHDVQEGPFDLPEPLDTSPSSAWDQTLSPIINDVVERVPRHAAILLSIYAVWELDEHASLLGGYWPDGIGQVLKSGLAKQAGARDLDRFNPRLA